MKQQLKKDIEKREERILLLLHSLKSNQRTLELKLKLEDLEESFIGDGSARCVFVTTKTNLPAPDGRSVKKKSFKAKSEFIKFRCSYFEKKLLKVKAKKCGLTLSEYIRKTAFEEKIRERLTDAQIDIYKMLVHYHNSFKSIGNMYKQRNPNLTEKVHQLADEIKQHLKNFKR